MLAGEGDDEEDVQGEAQKVGPEVNSWAAVEDVGGLSDDGGSAEEHGHDPGEVSAPQNTPGQKDLPDAEHREDGRSGRRQTGRFCCRGGIDTDQQ